MDSVNKKKEQLKAQLNSEHKRKYFEDTRRKMLEARHNEQKEEEW
jgi:hypothetical protein